MAKHKTGTRAQWLAARLELLEAEKELTRRSDEVARRRQETWEESPTGWPQRFEGQQNFRTDGRPTAQWSRLKAGYSDDLGTGRR